jgi:D-serine deaminase-like pyridoxal phosphate-dependent protein
MTTNSSDPGSWNGKSLTQVDTPSLLLDAKALHANIQRMASYFADRTCKLRPHFKSHKCTRLARLQMDAGAIGITCAKLGEAEVLADAGIKDILIANQIVGPIKAARLVALAKLTSPMVAIDSELNARAISDAAVAAQVKIRALLEINIGMNRCGVAPGSAALALAQVLATLPGIQFEGLQGYEGHSVDLRDPAERVEQSGIAHKKLIDTRRLLERSGIPLKIVSGGGTGTYDLAGNLEGFDEVQAGSYACMDWWYSDIRPEFRQALSLLATVTSRPRPEMIVIDVGRKGTGAEFGLPRVKNFADAKVLALSEEHTTISVPADSAVKVGDRLEIIPSHGCTTSNLYREFVVYRNGIVEDIWPIEGSGRLR